MTRDEIIKEILKEQKQLNKKISKDNSITVDDVFLLLAVDIVANKRIKRLIQVAAVAVQMIECSERNKK